MKYFRLTEDRQVLKTVLIHLVLQEKMYVLDSTTHEQTVSDLEADSEYAIELTPVYVGNSRGTTVVESGRTGGFIKFNFHIEVPEFT